MWKRNNYSENKFCKCDRKITNHAKSCLSCAIKERYLNPLERIKVGNKRENHWHWKGGKPKCHICKKILTGYKYKKCRECYLKNNIGTNNGRYIDGSSGIYPLEFKRVRKQIYKRDNYECQKCNITERSHLRLYNRKLCVHHIDYNKQNNNKNNLITLCNKCNNKSNNYRDYWYAYFKYLMENFIYKND